MRRLPPLRALRAFEAAARHSSVTAAAAELNVSHSAISQQLKQLEHYFGQGMFVRAGRRVMPTAAAEAFLNDIKEAFDLIAAGAERFTLKSTDVNISINTTPSFALRWLIPNTSQFQLENPSIKVIVHTSESDEIDHLDQPYDFIVRKYPMGRRGFKCLNLLPDETTPLVAPSLLSKGPMISADALKEFVLLHMKSRPDAWKRWLARHTKLDSDVVPGPFFDHFFLSLQAAISGLGVALGPLCLVEDDIAAGRLVAPFPDKRLESSGFHILFREDAGSNRHHKAFLEALIEAAGRSASRFR